MGFVQRSETVLGVHPRACSCAHRTRARVVADRRWEMRVGGIPAFAFRARWTQCAGCWRRTATPRFAAPTLITLSLLLALLSGLGLVPFLHPYLWAPLAALWGTWMLMIGIDGARDRRLVAAPRRTARPTPVGRRRSGREVVWDDDVIWDGDIVWDDADRAHVVARKRAPARAPRAPASAPPSEP